MVGALILVAVMLIMVPLILVVGGLLFAFLGWSAKADVDQANEGSELIDLNT